MQPDVRNAIRDLFAEACKELFVSLDCQISHCGLVEEAVAGAPTAVIDAGSAELDLFLVMRMPYSVLAMTYPVMGEDINKISDVKLEDWLSELANLLMGRIKAKFYRHRCEVMLGLPVSYFGGEIEIPELGENTERFDFPFELDHELCECLLDVKSFQEDIGFSIDEDAEADMLNEGEIELF